MASAMLTASLPEEYHHNGSTSAATVDPATSSSNHSSPGSHELSHSPQRRPNSTDNHHNLPHLQPDKVTEDGGAEEDSNEPVLALGNLKTEALSYHGSLSGRSSTEIPVVVENEAEPNSRRDHGEMLLEKLEKEFQTTPAPRSLFNGGDNSSDGLGTPPGLQIVLPADPDVSINSSSGKHQKLKGKWVCLWKTFHLDSYLNLKSNLSFYLEEVQNIYDYSPLMNDALKVTILDASL